MTVTIKDIADRVGKSIATVSRALHDHDDIGEETKALVRQTAKEMGYFPNVAASQLQKRRSDTIGLILPDDLHFSDPFFGELVTGLIEEIDRHGYSLLVTTIAEGEDELALYLTQYRGRRVDGFILARMQVQDDRIDMLLEENIPFTAFGRMDGENIFPFVDDDSLSGMRKAVNHLADLGHTRIGGLFEPRNYTKSLNRIKGFYQGLDDNNLQVFDELIMEGGCRRRSGYLNTKVLLKKDLPPTAIVAANDLMALGAMKAIQESGLVVGKDVSVVGFDDISIIEHVHPHLTTLHIPVHQIGLTLFQLLLKQIKNESIDTPQVLFDPELIIRESTGPVKNSSLKKEVRE